jgi:tetratricopeptide (TPR) repeat protein
VGESIGLSPELLPGIVTEAAEARLVSARDDAPERYRFSHTLIREVLYDELPSERRASLHSRAGAALERQCADELDLHSSALAHHYSSAASTGSVQKAVEYCVRAGRVAASQYAWEEACGHWQRGLAMLELLPVDAAERCPPFVGRIYEDLGDGYGLIGDADRAIEAYEHAARHLPREDNVCLARVTRKQVDHLYNRVRHGQALAVVSQANALLGTPSEVAGRDWWQEWIEVQLSRARLHFWSGETDDARMLVEAMEPSVTSQGTQTQHADCALLKWLVHLRQRRFVADAQTVKSAEVCAKRFVALGSATDLQDAQMVLGVCYLHSPARRGRAREHLVCYLELARQNHDVLNQITALEALSVWHRWRGEVEQVRSYASGVLALAKDRQIVRHLPEARGDLAWAAWRTGQAEEARALATAGLEELERTFPRSAFEWRVRWPLFGLSHVAGDLDEAALQARAIRDPLQSKMPHGLDALSGRFVEQHSRGIPETEGTAHALAIAARTLGYL